MIKPKLKQVQVGDGATVYDLDSITRGNTIYDYGKIEKSFPNLAYKMNVCKRSNGVNKLACFEFRFRRLVLQPYQASQYVSNDV